MDLLDGLSRKQSLITRMGWLGAGNPEGMSVTVRLHWNSFRDSVLTRPNLTPNLTNFTLMHMACLANDNVGRGWGMPLDETDYWVMIATGLFGDCTSALDVYDREIKLFEYSVSLNAICKRLQEMPNA